ncbi:MAG: phosphoribosylaminoimidazolesuccinocarboxamide synthase [Deltaproteobacteria bacterium]|nr:phosphoribosylaminoimidazolesuccinocarboxamide synthase [Deltaproteobacteria bacterium]
MERLIEGKPLRDFIYDHLESTVSRVEIPGKSAVSHGKVRDIFQWSEETLLIAVSDRVSVFDRVVGTIPFKGQVLNGISNWWMKEVENILPNHLVSVPHKQLSIVKKLSPLPVEVIARGYLTGSSDTSILTAYKNGVRTYCGHTLPEGMKPHTKLERNIITPTTKGGDDGHDHNTSRDEIISSGLVSEKIYNLVEAAALNLFETGQKHASAKGLILADTKYEFGLDETGTLYLIDEIHTPDSSRYWYFNDYEERLSAGNSPRGLDKDTIRHYMQSIGYNGNGPVPEIPSDIRIEAAVKYINLYEILTGSNFIPESGGFGNIVP